MWLSFADIYASVKTVITEERGSLVALVMMQFLSILGANEFIGVFLTEDVLVYKPFILLAMMAVIFVIWLFSRRIYVDHRKISIGIAPFSVIDTNLKEPMGAEKTTLISKESVNNVFAALNFYRSHLYIERFLQYIRLPRRLTITSENAAATVQKLGIDILIYGDIHYHDGAIKFAPRFEFLRHPSENAFRKFIEKLNDLNLFELKFEEKYDEVSVLMHYITYIALLFRGIYFSYYKKFSAADEVYESAMKLIAEEKESKTLFDIKLAIEFARGKNFHLWGNYLQETGQHEEALVKYAAAEQAFFARAAEIEASHAEELDPEELLHCSYLYAVHMLVKEGKLTEARLKLLKIEQAFLDSKYKNDIELADAEIVAMTDIAAAKKIFAEIEKDPAYRDMAERKLGHIAYKKDEWQTAVTNLRSKLARNPFRLYEPEMYDVRSRQELARSMIEHGQIVRGEIERVKAFVDDVKNKHKENISFE